MLVEEDESWFSRFAQPAAHAWAAPGEALRLVEEEPPTREPHKALACYGAVEQDADDVYLYFCEGQPNSEYTFAMLGQLLGIARQAGKRVLAVIWDHASWHKSKRLHGWIRAYNQQAKQEGDVRLLTCLLPKKSPWLNPMEPRWIHAKRKICEPDGKLSVAELKRRLCAHFHTDSQTAALKVSAPCLH